MNHLKVIIIAATLLCKPADAMQQTALPKEPALSNVQARPRQVIAAVLGITACYGIYRFAKVMHATQQRNKNERIQILKLLEKQRAELLADEIAKAND